ncbi:hypothetical protein BD310DRAFT_423821 [Dichomitus squalens]|uniref:Uncharacterized protein n=1 Tax=Dichomitus squalens TaxID=114155 RepID=A0A4Q9PXE0_9APHY|nr:hypothetical protein BD310DRAFT_423821 [Dichomitus squalens]
MFGVGRERIIGVVRVHDYGAILGRFWRTILEVILFSESRFWQNRAESQKLLRRSFCPPESRFCCPRFCLPQNPPQNRDHNRSQNLPSVWGGQSRPRFRHDSDIKNRLRIAWRIASESRTLTSPNCTWSGSIVLEHLSPCTKPGEFDCEPELTAPRTIPGGPFIFPHFRCVVKAAVEDSRCTLATR